MKRLAQALVSALLFLIVASWMIEWAIWGIWLAPVVLGIYLFVRDGAPGKGLRDRYLAMLTLTSAWPYGYVLGAIVLPQLPRWLAGMGLMPFREEHLSYVATDDTIVWLLFAFSIMGYLGLLNVTLSHFSTRLAEYEDRVRFYAVTGIIGTIAAATALYLTAHPIAAVFLAAMGGFWFLAYRDDPVSLLTKLSGASAAEGLEKSPDALAVR